MIEVETPDGSIAEFPDGTDHEVIKSALQKRYGRANPDYSNEGRNAAAQKPVSATREIFKALGGPVGEQVADLGAGVGKTVSAVAQGAEEGLRDLPAGKLLTLALKSRGVDTDKKLTKGLADEANAAYDQAGPLATAAKIGTDIAVTAGPSKAVGTEIADAASKLPKVLKGALAGAGAGAAGAGYLPPGEGTNRALASAEGAALGMGVGAVGAAADPALKWMRDLVPNASRASGRAVKALRKALGKPQIDSINANLQNPRELPMTTAAASGNPGLAQIENQARANVSPRTRARWEGVDERTSQAAWQKTQEAFDRGTKLDEATTAFKESLDPVFKKLDAVPVSQAQRAAFTDKLEGLKNDRLFQMDDNAKWAINKLIANVADPNAKLGSLAQYELDLARSKAFSPDQAAALQKLVRETVDITSRGAWSKALTQQSVKGLELEQSQAANKMFNDFMDEGGVVRGVTGNELPKVTSSRLRNAMAKQGIADKGQLSARDKLHPDDREQLNNVVRALQQAEYPRSVPAGKAIDTGSLGDALQNVPDGSMSGRSMRALIRVVTGKRDDATAKAIETALRSPRGWESVMKMGDKRISDDEAALLARILRAGPAATATRDE